MSNLPVSADHLEVLGKQASVKWATGGSGSLTDAVVAIVKHAHLSPEQVKRVVEFANTAAYLTEFKKEGGDHKFIDFGVEGPANAASVLSSLNNVGSGTLHDRGTSDYDSPPAEKTASVSEYTQREFNETFSVQETPLQVHDPFSEVVELRDKIAGAQNVLSADIDTLELQYADIADRLYGDVKQACLGGASLGQVVQAWTSVAPTAEFAKVAFQLFTPRLLREGVFHSPEDLGTSITKTAAAHEMVNEAHPLVLDFKEYCDTLQKLAESRAVKEELRAPLATLTVFLKQAGAAGATGKALKKGWDAATSVSGSAGKFTGDVLREAGHGTVGQVAETGISHLPHIAALALANDVRLHAQNSPAYHKAMALVPGTREHDMHRAMMQQGY